MGLTKEPAFSRT